MHFAPEEAMKTSCAACSVANTKCPHPLQVKKALRETQTLHARWL